MRLARTALAGAWFALAFAALGLTFTIEDWRGGGLGDQQAMERIWRLSTFGELAFSLFLFGGLVPPVAAVLHDRRAAAGDGGRGNAVSAGVVAAGWPSIVAALLGAVGLLLVVVQTITNILAFAAWTWGSPGLMAGPDGAIPLGYGALPMVAGMALFVWLAEGRRVPPNAYRLARFFGWAFVVLTLVFFFAGLAFLVYGSGVWIAPKVPSDVSSRAIKLGVSALCKAAVCLSIGIGFLAASPR